LFIAIVIITHFNSSTTPLSHILFLFRTFAVVASKSLKQIFLIKSVELLLQISLLLMRHRDASIEHIPTQAARAQAVCFSCGQ